MPNPFPRLLAIFTAVLLVATSRGDVVILKGGEKLEGKITEETATEVKMNVQVSASISDERTIPRAEIEKIDKSAPDEDAWVRLKTLQPGANSLPKDQYDRYIAPLKAFTTQFPKSAHFADAQKALAAFEDEKKRVEAGELKLDGEWLSKEQAQAERYQINGQLTLRFMRSEQARGDLISALNVFDVLEKQFPNSKSYPEAVELAIKIIPSLKAQAAARLAAIPEEKSAQEKAIAAAIEPAKSQMKEAAAQARKSADAALQAANRQKWAPFIPSSDIAMRSLNDKGSSELNRLGAIDLSKIRQSIELAEKARQQIADKDLTGAEASLAQATTLWRPNEMVARFTEEIATAKAAAAAAAPKPKATPAPATPAAIVKNADAPAPTDEPPPSNPWMFIVVGVILAFFGIVGFKIYRDIKRKANEVLE